MEILKGDSLTYLRHELRTPVNHILGYSELLIEDASERHLEAFIPTFQQIQSGGRQLLASIEATLNQNLDSEQALDIESLKENLRGTAREVLGASTSLHETLENGHQQTLADLAAISLALHRLMEFTGEQGDGLTPNSSKTVPGVDVAPGETVEQLSGGRGGKILIADDDPGNRDLLSRRPRG